MALTTESTVRIKIDLPNLEKTSTSLKNLAASSSDLATGAKSQISTIDKLTQAVRSGSKLSDQQINRMYSSLQEYNNGLSITIKKYNQELNTTLNTISELEQEIDKLTKKQRSQKTSYATSQTNNQTSNVFKKAQQIYGQKNQHHTAEEVAIANGFATYKDAYNVSLKSMEKATPEEQARIKVAREIIDLYKIQKQKAQESEDSHKKALEITNKTLEEKKTLLKEAQAYKKELDRDPIKAAMTVNTGLGQTTDELASAKYDMAVSGAKSAEVINPNSWKSASRSFMKTGIAINFLRRAARSAVQTIQELDKAVTNMTVVTGESREETEKYVASFVKIAQASSSTITEIAGLTTEYVRQGRSMKDAMTLAEETAKAAKIAGISTADSLTYMTSAINGFNLAAKDAAHVSDVFAKIAAETATDYEQLAVALSKVSAQASQAGLSIEYTTALLAKGIETTQEAPESIGTALKTIIARFRELSDYGSTLEDGVSVNQVEEALRAVGIEARDQAGNFRDLDDILNELGPRWDSLTSMQRQAIAQAAAGTRQQSRFLAIMQDWNRTMQIVNKSQTAAGASAAQYAKYAKGLEASITNMKSSWQSFVASLTDSSIITGIIDTASSFLNIANSIVGVLGKSAPYIVTTAGAIVAMRKINATQEAKHLANIQKEISMRMQLTEEEEKGKEVVQSKALTEVQNALKVLETNEEKERSERLDILNNDILEEQAHQDQLKRILEESAADTKAAKNKLELLAEEAEANGDISRANAIRNIINNASTKQATLEKGIKEEIAASEKRIGDLTAKKEEIEKDINKRYSARKKSLKDLENQTRKMGAGLTLTVNNLTRSLSKLGTKDFWKGLGSMAVTAGVAFAVTKAVEAIDEIIHTTEESLENIAEITANIHDNASKAASVSELATEYDKLSKSIHRTAEEEDRLKEIEEEMLNTYGVDVNSIEDFENKIDSYNIAVAAGTQEAISEAMKASLLEGKNLFADAEFETTIKMRLQALNAADTSTAQGQFQSKQYEGVVDNLDTAQIAQNALNKYESKENSTGWLKGIGGAAAGAAVGAGAAAALVAAGIVSNPVGWAVGIIGGAALAVVGAWHWVKQNSGEYAQKSAEEVAEQTARIAREINDFSEGMAEVYDQDLATQYERYNTLVGKYGEITQAAIKDSNKGLELIKKMNLTSEEIRKLQGSNITDGVLTTTFSNEEMSTLIKQAGELGEQAGKAFITQWTELTNKGLSKQEIASNLLSSLTSSNTTLGKSALAQAEADKKAAYKDKETAQKELDIFYNMKDFDTFLKENKEYKGMSYSEVEAKLKAAVDRNVEAYDKAGNAVDNLSYTLLETISTFDTLQELGQGLTALDSSMKNALEFADRLEQGETTIEDWNLAATKYQDLLNSSRWKSATNEERANMIRMSSNAFTASDERKEMIDNFILRAQAEQSKALGDLKDLYDEGKLDKSQYDAQVNALKDNTSATIAAAEEMKKLADTLTAEDISNIIYDRQMQKYDKGIEEGNIDNFENKISLIGERLSQLNKEMDSNWSQWEADAVSQGYSGEFDKTKWRKMMDDLLAGDASSYNAWVKNASDGAKTAFKVIWSTYSADKDKYQELIDLKDDTNKSYLERQIEIQNEALEVYKEKLEAEKDALQESLDKRKDIYEKYFDALDEESSDTDFASEQARLQQAISALSTATDATSLNLKKQYQEELAELEKEQLQTERDRRREATLETFDNTSERIDQYYDDRLNNEQALWSELSKLSVAELQSLYTTYNKEYQKSTDLNKAYLLESFQDIINGVKHMSGGKIPGYSKGGLVKYTGIAAVHGSPSAPEAFLNASQTALFSRLANNLENFYSQASYQRHDTDNKTFNIENITIAIDAQLTDNNLQETGDSLANAFLEGIRRNGININMKR